METLGPERFCGREVNAETLSEIREIVHSCTGLSRTELANTVCELWDWKRPRGGVKTRVSRTESGEKQAVFSGTVRELTPLQLDRVINKEQRDQWYELVDRYHYLGYQVPFGAQVRYFIESRDGKRLGCLQFN